MKKITLKNCIYFCLIFLIEIYIGIFVKDKIIRPYIGDILVIPLIYSFLNIFFKNNYKKYITAIVIFAIFIEILQFYNLVKILSINNKVLKIVIGSTFDFKDIICYVLGGIISYIIINLSKIKSPIIY
ncbi:MAG: DUF2809 domain-containing protein [Fusobacteriaceae bacterium]